jgi:hypothetical protein
MISRKEVTSYSKLQFTTYNLLLHLPLKTSKNGKELIIYNLKACRHTPYDIRNSTTRPTIAF